MLRLLYSLYTPFYGCLSRKVETSLGRDKTFIGAWTSVNMHITSYSEQLFSHSEQANYNLLAKPQPEFFYLVHRHVRKNGFEEVFMHAV